jgi:pyruvate/2-oxoglutarate dehydrogenase complex dihydrolipoamide dehydrogenase (E3) component
LISLKAEQWRRQVDLIVVGSGRAARTAAIRVYDWGAMMLLVEKYERFGGTVGFPAA